MIDRHVRGRKLGKNDSRRIEVYQFLHVALVGYHETRPAEDEEEIAAAEGIEASMITGTLFKKLKNKWKNVVIIVVSSINSIVIIVIVIFICWFFF